MGGWRRRGWDEGRKKVGERERERESERAIGGGCEGEGEGEGERRTEVYHHALCEEVLYEYMLASIFFYFVLIPYPMGSC